MQRYWISVLSALVLALAGAAALAQTKSPPTAAAQSTPAASDSGSISNAARPDDDEDNADVPAIARGRVNEQEYLRLRDQQAGMKRGIGDLARNPQLRSQAVQQMEAQEQALRQRRLGQSKRSSIFIHDIVPTPSWTFLGPDPIPNGQTVGTEVAVSGRVTAIAIDPTDSTGNTVYVGTAQGGLYRTLDGGSTWLAMMDSAQSLAIGALALDPTDHTVLFVGTGEGNFSVDSFFGVGLYIFTNANSSFVPNGPFNAPTTTPLANPDGFTDVFSGRSITQILVNPANHSQILISTSSGFSGASSDLFSNLPTRGVYLSSNVFSSGSTVGTPTVQRLTLQTAAGTANRPVTDMVMDPGNPNLVLVNVFGQSGTEGGIWTSPSTVWAGTGIWTQTMQTALGVNGKFAVNRSGTPTATTTFFAGLDQKATSGACTGSEGMLFRAANNGGSSWTELPAARGFCGGQCFYDMPVAADPTTASNLYLGGQAGSNIGSCGAGTLGKSTNGGTNFSASQTLLHPDTHAIAIHPGNPLIIYTGNDGGIFRSNDGGTTWSTLNSAGFAATQFESIAVHPTDPNFTIGGTQDNGTPLLKPDGVTWTRADSGDGGFSAIDQNALDANSVTMYHTYFNRANTLVGYAVVGTGVNTVENTWGFSGCQGTTPGNGINCTDTVLFYAPLALGPGNPNTVYFATDRLYRSTDQGNTHTVVSQAPMIANVPISAIGISPLSDLVRIVGLGDSTNGTPNGHVFATTNGSSTLTDVTGPWTSKYIARAVIDPNNPNTAYVTLDGYGAASGHVWKTTNLSAATPAWSSMSSGIPDVPVNGFAVDPQNSNNLYAGTDIGVYNSVDGGNTWNPYGSGLPRVAVFDLKITAKRTVRIATHGRGMWEIAAVSPGIATTLATSAPSAPPTNGVTLTVVVNHTAGTAVPTGSIVFLDSGIVLGSSTLNGSATATLPTGNLAPGSHTFFAAYGGDGTYTASQSGFPFVVIVPSPDFSLNINASSVTIQPGQPANYSISLQPTAGFTGTVNFSCTAGLPAQASCSFSPSAVNVTSSGGATVLTITTTAPSAAPPAGGSSAEMGPAAGVFGLVLGLALLACMASGKPWRRPAFALLAFLSLTVVLTSCGGGGSHNPGTPPGTSTVTITATSGGTTHTATVTLVVQ